MLFREKKLLLFDLDGTLIDSAPDLALSINHMLESLGYQKFDGKTIDTWVGNGAQTLVKRALSGSVHIDENIADDLFEKALAIFLDYYEKNCCVATCCYKDVQSTLETLHKSYTLAIVTNKPYKFVAPILSELEILDYFALYIGGDSLLVKKPDPQPLLHICHELHIPFSASLMIGDSKNDILAARAAGIESVAVSYGYNYGEDIAKFNPDVTIDNFKDLLDLLPAL